MIKSWQRGCWESAAYKEPPFWRASPRPPADTPKRGVRGCVVRLVVVVDAVLGCCWCMFSSYALTLKCCVTASFVCVVTRGCARAFVCGCRFAAAGVLETTRPRGLPTHPLHLPRRQLFWERHLSQRNRLPLRRRHHRWNECRRLPNLVRGGLICRLWRRTWSVGLSNSRRLQQRRACWLRGDCVKRLCLGELYRYRYAFKPT